MLLAPCRRFRLLLRRLTLAAVLAGRCASAADSNAAGSAGLPAAAAADDAAPTVAEPLTEIIIRAREPRFVAPTRRDQIGRIWAPVVINGKGPFRLVLDTGASRSVVKPEVAQALGLAPDANRRVLLRGVSGTAIVPTIQASTFTVGDTIVAAPTLPIVGDPMGGADGILGTEGLADKRVYIDFRYDMIVIAYSHGTPPAPELVAIPFKRTGIGLPVIAASVGGVRVDAIIDTGAQSTIGNEALRMALVRQRAKGTHTEVTDITATTQEGETFASPEIGLGPVNIRGARITYGDMNIFDFWNLSQRPAILIGMDAIGTLDIFVLDYRRQELQLRLPRARH